jgi:hypothetical protein
MNYKTKAQELSFLSRDYAVAKDKKNWLALFDKNALVQDPIGKSPLSSPFLSPFLVAMNALIMRK